MMKATLDLFDIFLLVLGSGTLAFGIMYLVLRFDAWLSGRKW